MGPVSWPCPTRFAEDVVRGKVPAGRPVRAAAKRHLRDLEAQRFRWEPRAYEMVFEFLAQFRVQDASTGEQVPLRVLPWQAFVVGSLFGWLVRPGDKFARVPGTRRFRRAYVSAGKASGKTPLAAALGVYMITADGWYGADGRWKREPSPTGFIMASTVEQAEAVGLNVVYDLVRSAPVWQRRFGLTESRYRKELASKVTGGVLQAVTTAPQGRGKHGLLVSWVHAEEVHEWYDEGQLRTLDLGMKGRAQPMVLMATNAAGDRSGYCWSQREAAVKAAAGEGEDGPDSLFGFVAEVDDDDVPEGGEKKWWPVEASWAKANPGFGPVVRADYYWDQIERAKAPFERVEVLRLLFGHSPGSATEFVSWQSWRACEGEVGVPAPGSVVSVGIDLGPRKDLTAVAYVWQVGLGKWCARVDFVTPADDLRERDVSSTGQLELWAQEGHIEAVPGKVLNYEAVVQRVSDRIEALDAMGCMDPYDMMAFRDAAHRAGLDVDLGQPSPGWPGFEVLVHPQGSTPAKDSGLWMERSMDTLAAWIAEELIRIEVNPVLRWNLACVDIARDQKGNRRFVKFRGGQQGDSRIARGGSIDGIVALAMAVGLAELRAGDTLAPVPKWAWDDPDFHGSWY